MSRVRLRPALTVALLASAPAWAAPVSGDANASDPYGLALRWTLAALTAQADVKAAFVATPAAALPATPVVALPAGGVPDPGAYALMGLGLLAAGFAARHFTGRQRGSPKKTRLA